MTDCHERNIMKTYRLYRPSAAMTIYACQYTGLSSDTFIAQGLVTCYAKVGLAVIVEVVSWLFSFL